MVTAQALHRSAGIPSEPLRKVLNDPHPACRFEDGSPRIRRLTDFFEADVVCRGTLFRVAAPIRREISRETVRNAGRLNDIGSPRISGFRLAEEAMAWLDERGELRTEHLFVEQVPEGRPLDEALDRGYSAAARHRELTALQQEFARIGFSHGNLKPENLLLTPNDRLIVTRCYRAGSTAPRPRTNAPSRRSTGWPTRRATRSTASPKRTRRRRSTTRANGRVPARRGCVRF